jgi:tetratricopeptide (TPR) repeat protein
MHTYHRACVDSIVNLSKIDAVSTCVNFTCTHSLLPALSLSLPMALSVSTAPSSPPMALKDLGNQHFRDKRYAQAIQCYSQALQSCRGHEDQSLQSTLLSNRAACWLKLNDPINAEKDCIDSIRLSPDSLKALYRLSLAQQMQGNLKDCIITLNNLIKIDPKNQEALDLMRHIRKTIEEQEQSQSLVQKVCKAIDLENISSIVNGMQSLIEICKDSPHNAAEFGRKCGLEIIAQILTVERCGREKPDDVIYSLRLLAVLTGLKPFVNAFVDLEDDSEIKERLPLRRLCALGPLVLQCDSAVRSLLVTIMNIVKQTAETRISSFNSSADLLLPSIASRSVLQVLKDVLLNVDPQAYVFACDAFSAFISDFPNHYEAAKTIDSRMESVEERKKRLALQDALAQRSQNMADLAIELGILDVLVDHTASDLSYVRPQAVSTLGKLVKYWAKDAQQLFSPFLFHSEDLERLGESKWDAEDVQRAMSCVDRCIRRAALEAALLATQPDLGSWALQQPGGAAQIAFLVSTQEPRSLEIAAEVLCLAAGLESVSHLLSSLVAGNVVHVLLRSDSPNVRAAAASVLTKLSLKAQALTRESEEVAQILNAVTPVLKSVRSTERVVSKPALPAFSNLSLTSKPSATPTPSLGGPSLSSLERTIEVIAAISGKSYVKEEIVHGSSR